MPRLVLHPGSQAATEFVLQAGSNSIGRADGNDVQIADASVSGRHCEIVVRDGSARVRDFGSTNGTFLHGRQVVEAELDDGCTLRFGDVSVLFQADGARWESRAAAPSDIALAGAAVSARPGLARTTASLPAVPVAAAPAPQNVGAQYCRFHIKMPARYLCEPCRQFFCEACVATRSVSGVAHKFCRQCGAECVPVVAEFTPAVEKGFFARLPGAFGYPLRGVGVIIVIIGIVLVALLKLGEAAIEYRTLRMIIFGVIMEVFAGGYLFTYLQAIIHATEHGERELPDLPGISNALDDIVIPFGRLLTLSLVCFAPATGLALWLAVGHASVFAVGPLVAGVLGYLYFPMAFLAVATLDSLAGANPLVVVPSILKAPGEYVCCLLLLASVAGVQAGGAMLLSVLFPESWTIHSMGGLVAMVALMAFFSFLSLYLLIVAVHLLGLIFVTKQEQLAWLER